MLQTCSKELLHTTKVGFFFAPQRRRQTIGAVFGAAVTEIIEHLDAARLNCVRACVVRGPKSKQIAVITPDCESNVKSETIPAGKLRHRDRRFGWTRTEFQAGTNGIAARFGYTVRFLSVGPEDSGVGPSPQMRCLNKSSVQYRSNKLEELKTRKTIIQGKQRKNRCRLGSANKKI
ncbi:MAG: hypothetical protein BWX84_01015 [Verrucomicrobia bacterium ADurb.Bin118]|nr:MAG: hypothetical protein BWX84_01015 [Verrucomicrobia bacterium ADurb.Bin118]